ncbi:MAG: 2-oxoacid:acceptor oxidoreductase subunit alpha [bacterium]|nr:2-oxoacid:acceptor oxidoreductase subunit alpha [bacterium]
MPQPIKFYQGNEIIAHAAVTAGCKFFAGYPITPSSEIAAEMAHLLPLYGGSFIQMEDEIAAMGAVIGASLAGAKSMTATSGPGFSLKQEHIGFACIAEVPVVVVNVMRGGPSTGLPTQLSQADIMQARWGTHGDHPIIALTPAFPEELFMETVRAFNLSEQFRTPVIILIDEVIAHLSSGIAFPTREELTIIERTKPSVPPDQYFPYDTSFGLVPPMANYFEGYNFHVTGLSHDRTGFPTTNPDLVHNDQVRQHEKIYKNIHQIEKWEEFYLDDAEIGIFAYGTSGRSAMDAIVRARKEGIKVGLFRPLTIWPFPDDPIREKLSKMKCIIVPEINLGQAILEVQRVLGPDIPIKGIHRVAGVPIHPREILALLKEINNEL